MTFASPLKYSIYFLIENLNLNLFLSLFHPLIISTCFFSKHKCPKMATQKHAIVTYCCETLI